MITSSRALVLPFATLLAGACVADVEGLHTEDELGDDSSTLDDDFTEDDARGDDHFERSAPEGVDPDILLEPNHDDADLIVASGFRSWSITIVSGVAGPNANFGDGNAPDLYVKRFCGGAYRNRTPVEYNTTTPKWNSTLLGAANVDYTRSCYLELWDHDGNTHDFGGRVYLKDQVDTMVRLGLKIMTRKPTFTYDDDVAVYVMLKRT